MVAVLDVRSIPIILPCILAAGLFGPIIAVLLLRRVGLARPLGLV